MTINNLSLKAFLEGQKETPNAVLLDVRTAAEYQNNALADAVNIDIKRQDFVEEIDELDRKTTYFVYCRIGIRSANACMLMQRMGFEYVYNLEKGIEGVSGFE